MLTHRKRLVLIVASMLMVAALVLSACGSDGSDAGTDSTSSTAAPSSTPSGTPSAKGKPCVAVADPLPAGAPEVPVKLGPAPTELVVEDLTPGTGAEATSASTVTVDYTVVMCSNGKLLDSSHSSGQPFTTTLDQVIPGWQEGIPGMKVGGTRLLGIPPDLAYGADGSPPTIAPDETLWFVIELRDVQG